MDWKDKQEKIEFGDYPTFEINNEMELMPNEYAV